jgi:hypothetical protein
MLQGGTAPIHPVMGGGGALPAGFEQQSLLQGGEGAAIHPVQGGGAGTSSPLKITEGTLLVPEDAVPQAFDDKLKQSATELSQLTSAYLMKQRDGFWRRYNPKTPLAVERPRILTTGNCVTPSTGRLDDSRGEAGFDRLAILLPKSTEEILLFPPVQSSRRRFYACLKYLEAERLLDGEGNVTEQAKTGPKKVVLFAAPFFKLEANNIPGYLESNRKLLGHFLKLKAQYPHMYILSQSTAMNKMIGNCIVTEASSNPLLNMLEPTYVIYPFVRSREDVNPFDDDNMLTRIPVGGIIFSAAAENEATLPASNLPSKLAGPSTYIQKGERTAVAYLPNPKVEDAEINRLYKAMKVRCYPRGTVGQGGQSGPLQGPVEYQAFNPDKVRRYIVQASPAEAARDASGVKADLFEAAGEDELALEDVMYTRVPLDGRVYSFRLPGSPGVMDDWKAGRFTGDEAEFLNELQLRPSLLLEIFKGEELGPSPPERLAGFMQNMANGRCFTDERMLTASECQESRDFVNRVYNYYLMHDERVEELREEEEAARKRAARFRLQTAEGRMRDAETAEREAREEAERLLKQVRDNATQVGVDVERPTEDYAKSPITDGKIRNSIARGDTVMEPSESLQTKGQFSMQIIVFKRGTGEYWIGTVDYRVAEGEDPTDKAKQLLEALNKEYPGYYVMQDFN